MIHRWHKRIGRIGWTVSLLVANERDNYGFPGSRGYSLSIVVWKDKA